MVMAVIVGVLAGTWLAEYGGESLYAKVVRFVNDILLSAPSVLVGLFVYNILVAHMIGHFSALPGAVALALIAVPIITRTTEDVLKLQPTALRESGVALGTPLWTAIRKILWRSAGSGILTGGLLAFARISGETAPLLFTALDNQYFSWPARAHVRPDQPISALPLVIFHYALSPYDDLAAPRLDRGADRRRRRARHQHHRPHPHPGASSLMTAVNTQQPAEVAETYEHHAAEVPASLVKLRRQEPRLLLRQAPGAVRGHHAGDR